MKDLADNTVQSSQENGISISPVMDGKREYFDRVHIKSPFLTYSRNVSTKRSHILKQTSR